MEGNNGYCVNNYYLYDRTAIFSILSKMSRYYSGIPSEAATQWRHFCAFPPKIVAADIETVSLKDRSILGIGIAFAKDHIFYLTVDDDSFHQLIQILQNSLITKIWHNAPFDLRVLRPYKPDIWNISDTAIMSRLLGKRAKLEEAAEDIGLEGVQSAKTILLEYGVNDFNRLPEHTVARKCVMDCWATYILYERLSPQINNEYFQVEMQCIPLLESISQRGILIDQERRAELEHHYQQEKDYLYTVADGFGFQPGSNQQVGYILASRGNQLPITKTYKLKTAEDVLRKLRDPLAALVLNYRHCQKILSNYLKPLKGAERAYTTFHLDAATGRVSGTSAGKGEPDRNLCNIPKKTERGDVHSIRSMFLSDTGVWMKADESQAELRIMAYVSGDKQMQAVFDRGENIHKHTQELTGLSYDISKTVNYALSYGADAYTIANSTGYPVSSGREFIRRWMDAYPQAASWMKQQQIDGLRNGYVETLLGRKMMLPTEMGEKHCRNCAINYPIQGTAADTFKRTLIEIAKVGLEENLRLLVHDEFDFDREVQLPKGLESITAVTIPLDIDITERWDDN